MTAAFTLFYLFMRHERRAKDPIIDAEVLKGKPFQAANYFNLMYGAAVLGIMAFIPLYATTVLGMSTLASGLILTPRSVGQMVSSFVTSMFLPRWGYRGPMLIGTILGILSLILLGLEITGMNIFNSSLSGPVLLGIFMFITGIGSGAVAPAANNACIELMPNRIATITGVRGMFRQSGSALSIAISSMVLQNFSDIGTGFRVVYFGLAVILIFSIPFIFAMPGSATDTGQKKCKT
jgi:MFS family permease